MVVASSDVSTLIVSSTIELVYIILTSYASSIQRDLGH
jgi:hypothetical protein